VAVPPLVSATSGSVATPIDRERFPQGFLTCNHNTHLFPPVSPTQGPPDPLSTMRCKRRQSATVYKVAQAKYEVLDEFSGAKSEQF
jgi:hypothetical protein